MALTKALLIFNLNDQAGLRGIWSSIPFNLFDEVLAIDGNSTDGSYEFLTDNKVRTHRQRNMGRGNALAEAMEIVNSDVVVELSSDGNEDPNTIIHLLSEIERGADLAIASRFIAGGATDDSDDPVKTRRLGNKILTFLANAFWGTRLTDSTNGLRAFTREAWKMMRIYAPHFEAEFLISIRAGKLKLKIAEVSTKEGSRLGGKVKARTLRAGWQLLLVVVRELLIGNRFMA